MAPAKTTGSALEVRELCNALYASCQTKDSGNLFTQEELLGLGVVPQGDLELLTRCVNELGKEGLLKLMNKDSRPCWKVISREDAAKYRGLSAEEAIVFSYVESAGREGIWTKTIRSKSNLHQNVFTRCLKVLESKGLIKPTQSAKFPTRKLYILGHLQPLEEVSGGPFFTDGIIDEEFVRLLCFWLEREVYTKSWHAVKLSQKRKDTKRLAKEGDPTRIQPKERINMGIPLPPGYLGYPKVPALTKAINEAGLSSVTMKEAEVRHLLDLLCWDGRITKVMKGQAFKKVVPVPPTDNEEKPFIESPCGGCPVFDLCEDDGPINARTCTYFKEWLDI